MTRSWSVMIMLVAACDARETLVTPDPHLERMLDQHRADPYEANNFFPDGKTMQKPPPGTVAHDDLVDTHGEALGYTATGYLPKIPIPVTRELVEAGRRDFDVFCSPCHGVDGDGDGPVAFNMRLRKPPSLVAAPVTQYPPGQVYTTITVGYGLMPSYAGQLDPNARWGVVAYVQALGLARNADVADLPADVRAELEKEAKP